MNDFLEDSFFYDKENNTQGNESDSINDSVDIGPATKKQLSHRFE